MSVHFLWNSTNHYHVYAVDDINIKATEEVKYLNDNLEPLVGNTCKEYLRHSLEEIRIRQVYCGKIFG